MPPNLVPEAAVLVLCGWCVPLGLGDHTTAKNQTSSASQSTVMAEKRVTVKKTAGSEQMVGICLVSRSKESPHSQGPRTLSSPPWLLNFFITTGCTCSSLLPPGTTFYTTDDEARDGHHLNAPFILPFPALSPSVLFHLVFLLFVIPFLLLCLRAELSHSDVI